MGMGIFGLASTVSFAFGPMVGLAIVGNDNRYLLMFAVCGILYLISAGITAISFILSLILFNNKTRSRRSPRFAQHMMKVKNGELDV